MNDLTEDDLDSLDVISTTTAHVAACALGLRKYESMSYAETVEHIKPLMESAIMRAMIEYGDDNR